MKAFILVLLFEATTNTMSLHNIEFTSRQSCEAAKVVMQAKAKQQRTNETGAKVETLKLIEATCLEK